MDRRIVYPGQEPLDLDILTTNQNAAVAIGAVLTAIMGSDTVVSGLACTPGTGLQVFVGPGGIVVQAPLEPTPYGSIAADTTDSIGKHGYNLSPTAFTIAAPGTPGQAINYLIQASFLEADTGSTVLPYYDAADPNTAYSGPSNSGTAQNTLRTQRVSLQLKAGVAATVGTQTRPAVDAGWVGLWVITVNQGAVSILSGNIVQYPSAPFLPTTLPKLRRRLAADLTIYVDSTIGNDSNSGLVPWDAFATLQRGVDWAYGGYDTNGNSIGISVAAGTYAPANIVGPMYGGGTLFIVGAGSSTIVSAVNDSCLGINGAAFVRISLLKLTATGTGQNQGSGIIAFNGANVGYSSVEFSACSAPHIVSNAAYIIATGTNTVSGNATSHIASSAGGQIVTSGSSLTLAGTPNFSLAFAFAEVVGTIQAQSTSFSGAATGLRHSAITNAVIHTASGDTSYFPGNSPGTTGSGGQFT